MIPKQRRYEPSPTVPAETLAAAIAGDRHAFGEIYRTHHDEVLRFVYYRVPSKILAEDITAETFVRAIRAIAGFVATAGGMGAWLFTIARNLIADHFKHSRYRREVTVGVMYDADVLTPAPDGYVLIRLEDDALRRAVGRLNDSQRECITLRFLQGLSVAETADAMGKNEGAIKTLQYRAVRTLGRLVGAERDLAEAGTR